MFRDAIPTNSNNLIKQSGWVSREPGPETKHEVFAPAPESTPAPKSRAGCHTQICSSGKAETVLLCSNLRSHLHGRRATPQLREQIWNPGQPCRQPWRRRVYSAATQLTARIARPLLGVGEVSAWPPRNPATSRANLEPWTTLSATLETQSHTQQQLTDSNNSSSVVGVGEVSTALQHCCRLSHQQTTASETTFSSRLASPAGQEIFTTRTPAGRLPRRNHHITCDRP